MIILYNIYYIHVCVNSSSLANIIYVYKKKFIQTEDGTKFGVSSCFFAIPLCKYKAGEVIPAEHGHDVYAYD